MASLKALLWAVFSTVLSFVFSIYPLKKLDQTERMIDPPFVILTILTLLGVSVAYLMIIKGMRKFHLRSDALKYLVIAAVLTIALHSLVDMFQLLPDIKLWLIYLIDVVYNIGFCVLFIVWFKLADVYFIDFFDHIRTGFK